MNRIKRISSVLWIVLAMIFVGCSGSDTYRGAWKATDAKGAKFDVVFDAKKVTIKDSSGKKEVYDYSQNSVAIENSVATYGIQLGDGRSYQINFPNSEDESLGLIKDDNGNPMYTISRKNYIKYEDVFKL